MARFLVIRLSSIGDIVHALPAVAALGEAFPEAEIDWAIEPRYAVLLDGNPYVHRVLKVDTLGWRARSSAAATIEEIAQTLVELRKTPYDVAIDFQGLVKSAIIAWLSRSGERLGLAEYWVREPLAAAFYTERVTARNARHVIEESMALAEYLISRSGASGSDGHLSERSAWRFPLPRTDEDDRYVDEHLATLGAREFIVINPGGGWTAKRWPPENYAELIRRLEAESGWHVFLTGSAEEEPMIREIMRQAGSRCTAYFPSTLAQFIALARKARLFVGGDTGPMHLAAAAGTPIVAICGPTDPTRNGPFSTQDIALSNLGPIDHTRRGKNPSYIQGISVELVLEAVRKRLSRCSERPHG